MRLLTTAPVLVALSVLTMAAGCSSKSTDPPGPSSDGPQGTTQIITAQSGSRLQAKFLVGGGARQFVGFHDSTRNEDCTFQDAEAMGKKRCYPVALSASATNAFSDAACKVQAATAQACATDVKYGISFNPNTTGNCGQSPPELRKVLPASAPIYTSNQAGCVAQAAGTPPGPGGPVVGLGDIVPWSAFVEATETNVPGTAVAERVLVATDGARQHVGFHDPSLDVDCTFQVLADGVTRCLPDVEVGIGPVMYSDSSCSSATQVEAYPTNGGGGCNPGPGGSPNVWVEPSPTACGGVRNVYRLRAYSGDGSAQLYRYENEGSGSGSSTPMVSCDTAGTPNPNQNQNGFQDMYLRSIDTVLTPTFAKATRIGSGSDRLVPALVWPAGLSTALEPGWHDTQMNIDCTFTMASDGKMRCLPVASSATVYFTDTACKSTSLVATLNDASCIDTNKFARVQSTTCPTTTTIYAVTPDMRATPGSLKTSTGECAKTQAQGSGGAGTVPGVTVVDASQFVEATPGQ